MRINRNNYEEFFISYIDNELDEMTRQEVEAFVLLHPDLKEELEILQQTILHADPVSFPSKDNLLFSAIPGITPDNYEEKLLMYLDDELSVEEHNKVTEFLSINPVIAAEFSILQKTKLQPENITFDDKELLYRKSETKRIPLYWKISVAAAVLLLAGLFVINTNNNTLATGEQVAIVPAKNIQQKSGQVNSATSSPEVEKTESLPKEEFADVPVVKERSNEKGSLTPKRAVIQQEQISEKEEVLIAKTEDQPRNNRPDFSIDKNDVIISKESSLQQNTNISDVTTALNTTYNKHDAVETTNSEPIFASNDEKSKKGGLKGFLRKVTRTFEKNTNIDPTDGEDRLLVAGLAIKL